MQKIVIVGCAGSGKSTLARQLGALLDIEIVHLDALYWKPNWVKTAENEWQETIKVLLRKDSWILDGNFSSSRKIRFDAADTIIFLDFPRYLCLFRVLKRRLHRSKERPDRAAGCLEQLNLYLLKHIWTFPFRIRPMLLTDVQEYAATRKIIVLRHPNQTREFVQSLRKSDPTEVVDLQQNTASKSQYVPVGLTSEPKHSANNKHERME